MKIGVVKTLSIYPVKSLAGVEVNSIKLSQRGCEWDRLYAIYNAQRKIASGKNTRRFFRLDGILDLEAVIENDQVFIKEAKNNIKLLATSADANEYVSALTDCKVTIQKESDILHMDDGQVHLITTADLEALSKKHGSLVSDKRFRANIVLESSKTSVELLQYKQIEIGDALLTPIKQSERCRMVNLQQGEALLDNKVLKSVAEKNGVNFGIYLKPDNFESMIVGSDVSVL